MFVVLCNCPAADDTARTLARSLVEQRLAACVNLLPGVRSVYSWEGKLCEDDEITLLIKTSAERLPALRAAIVDQHPYDLPEIVALPVDVGASLEGYVAWVKKSCVAEPD